MNDVFARFRLEAYDRNANFQQPPVLLPDPLDVNWPTTGFQQLNSEHRKLLPSITREQIEAYFLHRLAGIYALKAMIVFVFLHSISHSIHSLQMIK